MCVEGGAAYRQHAFTRRFTYVRASARAYKRALCIFHKYAAVAIACALSNKRTRCRLCFVVLRHHVHAGHLPRARCVRPRRQSGAPERVVPQKRDRGGHAISVMVYWCIVLFLAAEMAFLRTQQQMPATIDAQSTPTPMSQ